MDCATFRDRLLDALDEPGSPGESAALEAHLATCPACAAFAARQRAVDARLARSLRAPALSPAFRTNLRRRLRRERARLWIDALPDIVHLGSCGVATLLCVALVPLDASTVLAGGAAIAFGSYVVLTIVRQSLWEIEQPDR